jgi:hypothetical protein
MFSAILPTADIHQSIAVRSRMLPIARFQFSLNAPSSAGARVNFVALQSGIG